MLNFSRHRVPPSKRRRVHLSIRFCHLYTPVDHLWVFRFTRTAKFVESLGDFLRIFIIDVVDADVDDDVMSFVGEEEFPLRVGC